MEMPSGLHVLITRLVIFRPMSRLRLWLGCGRRKPTLLATLAVFGAALVGVDWYQAEVVARHFIPIHASSATTEEFALKCNSEINRMHREYSQGLESMGQRDESNAFRYRFPMYILNRGGLCAHRAILLCIALRSNGIPARKLIIGLTENYGTHIVVEAQLDGEWRVLDPLFGYAYQREDGSLGTAADLARNPVLVNRIVAADSSPFPHLYPVEKYHYREVTRFNWFKFSVLKSVRYQWGSAADAWEPPFLWNWPLSLAGYACLSAAGVGAGIVLIRASLRVSRQRSKVSVDTAVPT